MSVSFTSSTGQSGTYGHSWANLGKVGHTLATYASIVKLGTHGWSLALTGRDFKSMGFNIHLILRLG